MPIPRNGPSTWQRAKQNQKAKSRGAAHPPALFTHTHCQAQMYFKTNLNSNINKNLRMPLFHWAPKMGSFLMPTKHLLWMFCYRYFWEGKANTAWTISTILSHSDIMERQEEKRRKNSKQQTRKKREAILYWWNMSFLFSHWQFSIVQYRYFIISDALTLLKGEWRTNICVFT